MKVDFILKGDPTVGEITKLDDNGTAIVRTSEGKTVRVPCDEMAVSFSDESVEPEEAIEEVVEEEAIEEVEEEVELQLGMTVEFPVKGETLTGTVHKIDPDGDKVTVKSGTKLYNVPIEKLVLVEVEETV